MDGYLRLAALAAPLVLIACGGPDQARLQSDQQQACRDAVANQIGQSGEGLISVREGPTPGGEVVYRVETPDVAYRCTIDDQLTVSDITGSDE